MSVIIGTPTKFSIPPPATNLELVGSQGVFIGWDSPTAQLVVFTKATTFSFDIFFEFTSKTPLGGTFFSNDRATFAISPGSVTRYYNSPVTTPLPSSARLAQGSVHEVFLTVKNSVGGSISQPFFELYAKAVSFNTTTQLLNITTVFNALAGI